MPPEKISKILIPNQVEASIPVKIKRDRLIIKRSKEAIRGLEVTIKTIKRKR
jgi:hypothetical protein